MFWGQIILCCGGCPVHCWMFSSISGLFSVDATSTPHPPPQLGQPRVSPDIASCFLGNNPRHSPVENHSSEVTASYLSLGKGSETCLGSCRIVLTKERRFTIQSLGLTEVEIMSTNKFAFIVEHFMNTYKIGKRQFFKSTYKLYNVIYMKLI